MDKRSSAAVGANHQPLRDRVRDAIRQRIVDGKLLPGQRIVERHIAAELDVSRLPIREALRMLEREGLVSVLPQRGAVVRRLGRADLEQLFDVREALEVLAVRRATENATAAEMRRLERTVRAAEEANADGRRDKEIQHRERFHDEIIAMAHNDLLGQMLEPLQDRMHWLFRQNDDVAGLLREHRALYDAMATRDPDAAHAEALAHVRRNRQRVLKMMTEREEPSA